MPPEPEQSNAEPEPSNADLLAVMARLRREQPRNVLVLLVCDELEKRLCKPSVSVSTANADMSRTVATAVVKAAVSRAVEVADAAADHRRAYMRADS